MMARPTIERVRVFQCIAMGRARLTPFAAGWLVSPEHQAKGYGLGN